MVPKTRSQTSRQLFVPPRAPRTLLDNLKSIPNTCVNDTTDTESIESIATESSVSDSDNSYENEVTSDDDESFMETTSETTETSTSSTTSNESVKGTEEPAETVLEPREITSSTRNTLALQAIKALQAMEAMETYCTDTVEPAEPTTQLPTTRLSIVHGKGEDGKGGETCPSDWIDSHFARDMETLLTFSSHQSVSPALWKKRIAFSKSCFSIRNLENRTGKCAFCESIKVLSKAVCLTKGNRTCTYYAGRHCAARVELAFFFTPWARDRFCTLIETPFKQAVERAVANKYWKLPTSAGTDGTSMKRKRDQI